MSSPPVLANRLRNRFASSFAGVNVVPADTSMLELSENGMRSHFRSIFASGHIGLAAPTDQPIQFTSFTDTRQGTIYFSRQRLARAATYNAQHAEPLTIFKRVRHEVQ